MSLNQTPKVTVKNIPAFIVAYVRHIGPYKGNHKHFEDLWTKLMSWAGPRDLLKQNDLKCLCAYQDDPEVSDETNLRVSICISVPADTKVDGEIGKMGILSGKYAVAHFEINPEENQNTWNYIFGEWMSKSGYQPDDGLWYELMLQDPASHPEHKHVIDIHVPVKPL